MTKAPKKVLEALHAALAQTLTDVLTSGEVVTDKETGELMRATPQASTLNVVRQFLKDNGIDSAPGTDANVNQLNDAARKSLPFPSRPDEHGFTQ